MIVTKFFEPEKSLKKEKEIKLIITGTYDWKEFANITKYSENEINDLLPYLVIQKHFYNWFREIKPFEFIFDNLKSNFEHYLQEFNIENILLNHSKLKNINIQQIEEIFDSILDFWEFRDWLSYDSDEDEHIDSLAYIFIKDLNGKVYELGTENYQEAFITLASIYLKNEEL